MHSLIGLLITFEVAISYLKNENNIIITYLKNENNIIISS